MQTVMLKGILALLVFGAGALFSVVRRIKARKELQLLDSGNLCIHCKSSEVTQAEKGVICTTCGMLTSWALIGSPSITERELAKMTVPKG